MRRATLLSPGLTIDRIAAAAVVLLSGVLVAMTLLATSPPTATQFSAADPLLHFLQPAAGYWTAALVAAVVAAAWLLASGISGGVLREAATYGIAGAVAGLAMTLLIRALQGDTLPVFIPAEESSAPGMALGFSAGLVEEALFRLGTLPLVYFALHRRTGALTAAIIACVATGFAFALSHEAGPAAAGFDAAHFLTRAIIPGIAMSVVAVVVHPAFMVAAHCAAHIGIALLFVAP